MNGLSFWLRYMRSQGTFAIIDLISLNHPPAYGRLKKPKKPKPKAPLRPTLAETLARVDAWSVDLAGGLKKSEIARREGLTRARVTQLMKLVNLPDEVKMGVKTGDSSFLVGPFAKRLSSRLKEVWHEYNSSRPDRPEHRCDSLAQLEATRKRWLC